MLHYHLNYEANTPDAFQFPVRGAKVSTVYMILSPQKVSFRSCFGLTLHRRKRLVRSFFV